MTETDAPEIPSEEETLTGEDGFDLDRWKLRASAGKYDGHLIEMAQFLVQRAVANNTRRWKLTVWDREVTEDDLPLMATRYAEQFTGSFWGILQSGFGLDPQLSRTALTGLLYGIGVTICGWTEKQARTEVFALKETDMIDMVQYYEVESDEGKGEGSEEPTTT